MGHLHFLKRAAPAVLLVGCWLDFEQVGPNGGAGGTAGQTSTGGTSEGGRPNPETGGGGSGGDPSGGAPSGGGTGSCELEGGQCVPAPPDSSWLGPGLFQPGTSCQDFGDSVRLGTPSCSCQTVREGSCRRNLAIGDGCRDPGPTIDSACTSIIVSQMVRDAGLDGGSVGVCNPTATAQYNEQQLFCSDWQVGPTECPGQCLPKDSTVCIMKQGAIADCPAPWSIPAQARTVASCPACEQQTSCDDAQVTIYLEVDCSTPLAGATNTCSTLASSGSAARVTHAACADDHPSPNTQAYSVCCLAD